MCPSYPDFKKDILPELESILDNNRIPYIYHKTDHYFKFPWSKGVIQVATAEKKIRGPNWAYACVNELTLISLHRYREIIGRVRKKGARALQVASCGTPEGIASDYFEVFIEKPMDGSRVIFGSTKDNEKNLAPGYIKMLESSFDSVMLDAYLKGLYINMTGNRFYYSYDPGKNDDITISAPDESETVHVTMDFNVDPMAAVVWKETLGGGFHAFDEITLNDADTNKMAEALKARGYHPCRTIIYPDPSANARSTKGQPDVQILKNHGYVNIRVRSSHPGLRQRQLNVNNLLEKRLLKINPIRCPELKKDLISVEQDKVKLDKIKSNPKRTHHSDGMDYMCDIMFPFSGKRPTTRIEKFK